MLNCEESAAGDSVVRTRNVRLSYTSAGYVTKAVDGISMEVKRGESVAIVGPSGSGKSTLMSLLGLLRYPDSGTIELGGVNVENLSDSHRAKLRGEKIGYVFQSFNLIPELRVMENVAYSFRFTDQVPTWNEVVSRSKETLEFLQLTSKLTAYPHELSGGEQQRVAVARAISKGPDLILLDEPTGNLDRANTQIILDVLTELNLRGSTILLVTHDEAVAEAASRVLTYRDGKFE